MDFYTITCALECSGVDWLINQGGVPIGIESIRARSQHRLTVLALRSLLKSFLSFFFFDTELSVDRHFTCRDVHFTCFTERF